MDLIQNDVIVHFENFRLCIGVYLFLRRPLELSRTLNGYGGLVTLQLSKPVVEGAKLHRDKFNKNIQWRDCPNHLHQATQIIIKDFWDVFEDEDGMSSPIRGHQFNIDTGECKPIRCRVPRFGTHEAMHFTRLADILEKKGIVEGDYRP